MTFKNIAQLVLFFFTLCSVAHGASSRPHCAQDAECKKHEDAVKQVLELKQRRHEDVIRFGRKSSQVKEDNSELAKAVQIDRDLRNLRRQEIQNQKSHAHHHRKAQKEPIPAGSEQFQADGGSSASAGTPARFRLR